MMFSLIGILFLIIPFAYLLASVVGLSYLWYRVLKGKRGGDLPTCARCGYGVRGLAGLNCPECGADLREVGITTPKQRGAVSPILFVLLWTLLLPGPTCLVSGVLVAIGPKQSAIDKESLELSIPTSGEYRSLTIERYHGGLSILPGSTTLTMLFCVGQTNHVNLNINPDAMTYVDITNSNSNTYGPTPSRSTTPLDRQAILSVLQRIGADPSRQDVIDEADELLGIVKTIPTQGLLNVTTTNFFPKYTQNTHDEPAVWFMLLMLGICIGFWILGFVFFFRIRRKSVPQVKPCKAETARFAPPSDSGPHTPPAS